MKTQLVKCPECDAPLARINVDTEQIHLITIKKTETENIPTVMADAVGNLSDITYNEDGMALNVKTATCACGKTVYLC